MKQQLHKLRLEQLLDVYAQRAGTIRQRLNEFRRVPPSDYFYELAYCLLTPQSSALNASRAVEELKHQNFLQSSLNPVPLLRQKEFYIRFHNTKGKHLVEVKKQAAEIVQHLTNGSSSTELREWLVTNVKGIGYKEASHFLRNIGHRDLAILDRHILKNLVRCGVIRSLPKTLTRKRYMAIEKKFQNFSARIGIPMDELDLLFWSMETGAILK